MTRRLIGWRVRWEFFTPRLGWRAAERGPITLVYAWELAAGRRRDSYNRNVRIMRVYRRSKR